MFCMLKKEKIYPAYVSNITQTMKTSYYFNDFKRRKTMALFCIKETISIINRNNF